MLEPSSWYVFHYSPHKRGMKVAVKLMKVVVETWSASANPHSRSNCWVCINAKLMVLFPGNCCTIYVRPRQYCTLHADRTQRRGKPERGEFCNTSLTRVRVWPIVLHQPGEKWVSIFWKHREKIAVQNSLQASYWISKCKCQACVCHAGPLFILIFFRSFPLNIFETIN